MKFCDHCGFRLAVHMMPGIRGAILCLCSICVNKMFDKIMIERAEATLQ